MSAIRDTASVYGGVFELNSHFRTDIEALRFSSLLNPGNFRATPEAVEWSDSDDRSTVLGIYSSVGVVNVVTDVPANGAGLLLSSMRVERITAPEGLIPKLDYDHLSPHVSFPCALFGKAVTRSEVRRSGLNTYLKYLAFQKLHKEGIEFVVGTTMPQAVQLHAMIKLGAKTIVNPAGWHRFGYQSNGPTVVYYLNLQKNYKTIMNVLEPKVRVLKERYPYVKNELVERSISA